MAAAKEKTSWLVARLLALLLLLAALAAPAQARSAAENRVWQKSAPDTESLNSQPLQLLNLHQVKAPVGWYDASGDTFAAESEAEGGVYLLRDPETGQVMRTGRTGDLAQRRIQHALDPALGDYEFEPVYRTDNYAEQRGLEQELDWVHNPPLNYIRPISPQNPNLLKYLGAANDYLDNIQGITKP